MKNNKNGFTMAETLIVIAVLGIIAILTIPNLFRNQVEAQHRTKVRKSMAAYEAMFNKMVMENGLRSSLAITSWADGTDNDCANTSAYFKKSIDKGCNFKTSDGVWWDITNIQRPIIAFKEENLDFDKADDPDDMDAFILVGRIDDSVGTIRVDDLQFETDNDTDNSKAQVEKLYGFISKKSNGNQNDVNASHCNQYDLLCRIKDGEYDDYTACSGVRKSCYVMRYSTQKFYYDENGVAIAEIGPRTNRFIINDGSNREVWVELDGSGKAYVIQTRISSAGIDGNCCDNERTRVEFRNGKVYHVEVFNGNTGRKMDVYYNTNTGNISSCSGSWMSCDKVKEEAYSRLDSYGYGVNNSLYPLE